MALTVALTGDWLESIGSKRAVNGKITFDASYTTGGLSLLPAQIGLGVIDRIEFNQVGGFVVSYDYTAQKVKAFVDGANLPTVKVTGGQAAGPALQITPDSAAGVLGKTTATDRTIPGATFGLTAVPAAMAEVAATTNLATLVVEFRAYGR